MMMIRLSSLPNPNIAIASDQCEECSSPAAFFLDAIDDEYCASLCSSHTLFTIAHMILND